MMQMSTYSLLSTHDRALLARCPWLADAVQRMFDGTGSPVRVARAGAVIVAEAEGQLGWLVVASCELRGPPAEIVRHSDGARVRELGLTDVVRDARGSFQRARLACVEVRGTGPDTEQLYRRLLQPSPITAQDLARFLRTGHLGGSARASEVTLLCQCLQIRPEEVPHVETVEAVERATGAGLVCGGCRPQIAALIELRARSPEARTAMGPSQPAGPALAEREFDVPEVRHRTFRFAREPLERIRGVPEMILIAATSVLSTPAERLIIGTLSEAAGPLRARARRGELDAHRSAELLAAVDAFLAQESNHIAAHAPLNRMLLTQIYPRARGLRRLGAQMLARYRDEPLHERLAVAAGYEYASDSIFGAVYEVHFKEGRRFHRDPQVHAALLASGVGPLFSWHALEELSHRHVAFEVAVALGVDRATLRRGMIRVLIDLARLQFPAILELVLRERDSSLLRFLQAVFVDPGFVRHFAVRVGRWMRPGFDPAAEDYDFLTALADEVDAHEDARVASR